MFSNFSTRLLLVDFGHPMTENVIQAIKLSLQNVLSMLYTLSGNVNLNRIFGISVLNSKYNLFGSYEFVKKNYSLIMTKLNSLDRCTAAKEKVTIQQYKYLMKLSVENILSEFQNKIQELTPDISLNKENSLEVIIITKKMASIVAKILVEVVNKLPEKSIKVSANHFKIIQLISEEENGNFKSHQNSSQIEWSTCKENYEELDLLFKKWLIQPDYEEQQIEIILSEEIEVILKCDLIPCVINPYYSSIRHISGAFKPTNNLKILHRILVADVYPSLTFGIPYKAYATRNPSLPWDQSQVNAFYFIELCKELEQTSQGLITTGSYLVGEHEIISFYFITSDGNSLFIKNLVPNELFFPQYIEPPQPELEVDPNAALIVKSCLKMIGFSDQYSPAKFSSGLYDFLRNYSMRPEKKSGMLGHIDPELKSTVLVKKPKTRMRRYSKHQQKLYQELKYNTSKSQNNQLINRQKINLDLESHTTHPALLPSEVVNKYRKINSCTQILPELKEDF